eukprot:CAMPEP_0183500374 /NCGR_PEP_ID=MMETSP0371-20130417/2424_1 /TAXON_ID=268820 /ORGANISM="Peridinium aciculiferum, Strain PAER-2" /LENGTH=71 /DNA_ID=CAMNT_0025694433 /DNA_START=160 /DNA_END=371 /DNA_ORIENTATION=+
MAKMLMVAERFVPINCSGARSSVQLLPLLAAPTFVAVVTGGTSKGGGMKRGGKRLSWSSTSINSALPATAP